MKIKLYNEYGNCYCINKIEYTLFNGKDTIIEYSINEKTNIITFEGWLSIEQIINKLYFMVEKEGN